MTWSSWPNGAGVSVVALASAVMSLAGDAVSSFPYSCIVRMHMLQPPLTILRRLTTTHFTCMSGRREIRRRWSSCSTTALTAALLTTAALTSRVLTHPNLSRMHSQCYYNGRYAMPKKKKKKEGKADLTTVLHIRELPHLHMKLVVWFSFPTTNNKNSMIPS